MARVDRQIDDIKEFQVFQILMMHCQWAKSGGKEGKRASLKNLDLRGSGELINVLRKFYGKVNFREIDFTNVDLRGEDLRDIGFVEAILEGTNFEGTNLKGSDLRGTNLSKVKWNEETIIEDIRIDQNTIVDFPKELLEKYGVTIEFVSPFDNPNTINRAIEFPPEYKQAGVGILNYFAEVLNQKYPEKHTKVKIEQDGLKVKMTIETEGGDKEEVEEFLDQYGLVVQGKLKPEKLLNNDLQVMELKHQLRLAEFEIENQRELLQLKQSRLELAAIDLKGATQKLEEANIRVDKLLAFIGQSIASVKDVVEDKPNQKSNQVTELEVSI